MKWSDIISLGLRNLTARKSRSLLTIGGVGVGIAAVIFLVSLGYGLQELAIRDTLQSKSLSFLDVRLGTSGVSRIDEKVITEIQGQNGVKTVYPELETPAKLKIPQTETRADIIAFFHDLIFTKQTDLHLASGRFYEDTKPEVIVSSALLKLLNIAPEKALNNDINFTPLIRDELVIQNKTATEVTFKVVGISDDDETSYLVAPIKPVAETIGEFAFSAAKVEVESESAIGTARTKIEDLGLQTEYIGDVVAQLSSIFGAIRGVLGGFGLIATFVAALGMFNTLSVSLMERTREIGIMKTLGTKRRDVWKLFLVEGMLISILGGIFGIILGLGVGEGINIGFNVLAKATGHNAIDFYYSPPVFLALMLGLVILLGALVGLIPARRATRISPLEALRYE